MTDFTLLLVEDDDFDIFCFNRALEKTNISYDLISTDSTEEAIDILLNKDVNQSLSRPYIIFCDVDMAKKSGVQLLMEVRENPLLKNSFFFLCSSHFKSDDLLEAKSHKVSGFINKKNIEHSLPVTLDHLNMPRRLAA